MKNLLFVLVLSVCLAGVAFASPFIVTDPVTNVDNCIITVDGVATTLPPVDGTCKFDVGSVSTGEHLVSIVTENIWGQSTSVPFSFTKELPEAVTNIRLEK